MLERFKTQKQMHDNLVKEGKIKLEKQKGIIAEMKSDKTLIFNLALMLIAWGSASFIFYLLNFFIKYMPGDIYINSVISGLYCLTTPLEGPMEKKLGARYGQALSFSIGILAAAVMCMFDQNTDQLLLYALVLFFAKSGAGLAFAFVYVIHVELFPTSFLVTSYGICNIFCRALTMLAPLVAEIPNKMVPLGCLVAFNVAGAVASSLIRKRTVVVKTEN